VLFLGEEKKEAPSRRGYLKTVGAGIVGLAVGAAIGYGAAPKAAPGAVTTVTKTETKTVTAPGAPAEGRKVSIYTYFEAYEQEGYMPLLVDMTGLDISTWTESTGAVMARLISEKAAPVADIVWGLSDWALETLKEENAITKPDTPLVNADKIDPKLTDPEGVWVGLGYWTAPMGVFHKDRAKTKGLTMPKSYWDLTDPKWKGEIIMPNPKTSGTATMFLTGIMVLFGEDKGWEFFDKLVPNCAQITPSGSAPGKLAQAGECVLGLTFDYQTVKSKEAGYPVEIWVPEEGVAVNIHGAAIINGAKRPGNAWRVLQAAISKPMMYEYYRSGSWLKVSRTDFEFPEALAAAHPVWKWLIENHKIMPNYDFKWVAKNRERLLDEWTKRYGV
jgi:iron(III) transport system substrate-binding protein